MVDARPRPWCAAGRRRVPSCTGSSPAGRLARTVAAMWSGHTWQCASMITALGLLLDQLLGQRVQDDLGGPFVDPHRPRLAVQPLDHAAADQPEPAHHLHGAVDDPAGRPRSRRPWPSRTGSGWRAGRGRPRRRPDRSATGPSRSRSRTCASMRGHRPEPGQRRPELLAPAGVPQRLVQRRLGDPDRGAGDRDPEGGQGGEHQREALARRRRAGGRPAPGRRRRPRRRARAGR